jgi:energy-coupling factor transporter ATP-binding protein EcfA2
MGELIGITGAIGSGKSTFAACLATTTPSHAHYESWYVIAEIADAFNKALKAELAYETTGDHIELANQVLIWLPDAISECLHQDVVWSQLAIRKQDTMAHPELYEKLLAYLAIVQVKRELLDIPLTDETKEQFRTLLQWLGGYFVAKLSKTIWYAEILRRIDARDATTSLVTIGGVRYPSDAQAVRDHGGKIIVVERPDAKLRGHDITEAERHAIAPDITVVNNGTPEQLQVIAEELMNDLQAGKPKQRYSAA